MELKLLGSDEKSEIDLRTLSVYAALVDTFLLYGSFLGETKHLLKPSHTSNVLSSVEYILWLFISLRDLPNCNQLLSPTNTDDRMAEVRESKTELHLLEHSGHGQKILFLTVFISRTLTVSYQSDSVFNEL